LYDVIIIGAGASGLLAASNFKNSNKKILIIEKNNKIGKKILATGNGKCNFSNMIISSGNYYGSSKDFVMKIINKFDVYKTIDFFKNMGILHRIDDNRVYPITEQASNVVEAFKIDLKYNKIEIVYNTNIIEVLKRNSFFELKSDDNKIFKSKKIIISTGGIAYPKFGSDGSINYSIKKLGHTFTDMFPGLVQLKLRGNFFKNLKGVRVKGGISIFDGSNLIKKEIGELLFTDYGISGIATMQISRYVHFIKNPTVSIDFFPEISENELKEYLKSRILLLKDRVLKEYFIGLINEKIIDFFLNSIKIKKDKVFQLNDNDIDIIYNNLKKMTFKVEGTNDWNNAQITIGGISLSEIDNDTLESKIIKGLYFCGEILDVDGDCGGYNLQWAWSSGYVASMNAKK